MSCIKWCKFCNNSLPVILESKQGGRGGGALKIVTNLVTFTEEIFNGKVHFLFSDSERVTQGLSFSSIADSLHCTKNEVFH